MSGWLILRVSGIKESLVEEIPLELSKEEGRTSTEIWGCVGNHEEHHLVGGNGWEMPPEEPNIPGITHVRFICGPWGEGGGGVIFTNLGVAVKSE